MRESTARAHSPFTTPDAAVPSRRPPTWPVLPLALPAAVSIWGGWVGLGQLTGFGVVQLLPGIWDGLRINTAVTLPVGMEAYASYALYVWLHRGTPRRARDFARVSSIAALVLGALGQVAYHLMAAAGVQAAPWPITAAVACLPVGVLGMGATLAHLLSTEPEDLPRATPTPVGSHPPADPPTGPTTPLIAAAAPAQPGAPVRPDPAPAARPDIAAPVHPAGQAPDRVSRPAEGVPRRRRAGSRPRTDAQLAASLRSLAERTGGPPSQYQVRQALRVGSGRAARLLAELGDLTPAGASGHHGTTGREGAR